LFRSAIGLFCLVAFLALWIAGARPVSLLLDRLYTVEIESRPIAQLGVADADHGMLLVNDLPMSTAGADNSVTPFEGRIDGQRHFVIQAADRTIALGRVDGLFVLKPGPGDKATLQIRRSLLSWPTPFEFNFLSGHAPSSKRHLYY
jgi:hypothetical protein